MVKAGLRHIHYPDLIASQSGMCVHACIIPQKYTQPLWVKQKSQELFHLLSGPCVGTSAAAILLREHQEAAPLGTGRMGR